MKPGTPLYPPVDQGIEVCESSDVLASQEGLIRRIKLQAGLPDEDFAHYYLSVIDRLAQNILLLPASETETHPGPGGLFRLSLEMAFYTAQAAEGVIFTGRATAEDRRREEPRWRYAAFLAGLCCELHRSVAGMSVVDTNGTVWPAFSVPLAQWLGDQEANRFFVRWTPNPGAAGQATASLMVSRIVPTTSLQYLQEGSLRIVPAMMDVIAGVQHGYEKHILAQLIETTREKVIARDKGVQPSTYGKLTVGAHLEPHLLDAMRQLVSSGEWKVNEKRARLWYSNEGLFLVWRTAAKEILKVLENNNVRGVPQDAQTLLDILTKAGVFVADGDGSPFWMIMPPTSSSELVAVRFNNPMSVFGATLDDVAQTESLLQPSAGARKEPDAFNPQQQESVQAKATQESNSQEAAPVAEEDKGGAIEEVEQPDKESISMAAQVANILSPATRQVMNMILTGHLSGKLRFDAGIVPEGFAISIEHLAGYGVPLEVLTKNLQQCGWLYSPPEKPGKKLHQVKLNNKPIQAIVIKMAQARDAGFLK